MFSGTPPTTAQRAAAIETAVKCPSCPDLSVAQSEATTSLAVRHEIVQMVDQGRSTTQIEQALVDQYGQTILLVPPASGGIAVIWLLPIVLAVGALVAMGVFFVRRGRQFGELRDAAAVEETARDG